jgi:hypothetical protein
METIHPIGPDEQLMARGEYVYRVSGKDSGLTERWIIHRTAGQSLVHRAVVAGSIAGLTLHQVSHFALAAAYRPQWLEMRQIIGDGTAERLTHTLIRCFEKGIEQSIRSGERNEQQRLELPAGYSLFFPPVSAHGFIVGSFDRTAGQRQARTLVSVRIQPQVGLPLSVEPQSIDYELAGEAEAVETPAGKFTCRRFIRYDQHMEQQLWLDDQHTVIKWAVPYSAIMQWEYVLTRYYREQLQA